MHIKFWRRSKVKYLNISCLTLLSWNQGLKSLILQSFSKRLFIQKWVIGIITRSTGFPDIQMILEKKALVFHFFYFEVHKYKLRIKIINFNIHFLCYKTIQRWNNCQRVNIPKYYSYKIHNTLYLSLSGKFQSLSYFFLIINFIEICKEIRNFDEKNTVYSFNIQLNASLG